MPNAEVEVKKGVQTEREKTPVPMTTNSHHTTTHNTTTSQHTTPPPP
jgi:hypothetical protein